MKTFEEYKDNKIKLSGKYAFHIFLDIIDDYEYQYLKKDCLNVYDFSYFFMTDKITDLKSILHTIKRKKSLKIAYKTLENIKNLRLAFYFGIKGYVCEYGFYDLDDNDVYKIGEFITNSKFFKKYFKHDCLKAVKKISRNINLLNLKILHKVKDDFKDLFKDIDSKIEILDEYRIKNSYGIKSFNKEDLNDMKLTYHLDKWARKYKWYRQCTSFILITEEYVNFYIKIKTTI